MSKLSPKLASKDSMSLGDGKLKEIITLKW